jgi:hypothetical protein
MAECGAELRGPFSTCCGDRKKDLAGPGARAPAPRRRPCCSWDPGKCVLAKGGPA